MGMYISISIDPSLGISTTGGIFDCIVEGTRNVFTKNQEKCMKEIYRALDDEGQSFIVLDYVDANCFNLFYQHCKTAMEDFHNTDRGKSVPTNHIPGILADWAEVLRLMREDKRYFTNIKPAIL